MSLNYSQPDSSIAWTSQPLRWIVAACSLLLPATGLTMESDATGWTVVVPLPPPVKVVEHNQQNEGEIAFHRFRFQSARDFQTVQLQIARSPALLMDGFEAAVNINSSQRGVRFGLQVVLPEQTDPRTGAPLQTIIFGDRYQAAEKWQKTAVRISAAAIQAKMRELRAEIKQPDINRSGAYVNGCVLVAELHKGTSYVDVSACEYGPTVAPAALPNAMLVSDSNAPVLQARVNIERNRILVDHKAVYSRFIPDHGEALEFFDSVGVNTVWVPDLSASERMQAFIRRKILVMATPPHPDFDPADFSNPLQGLPPLEQQFPLPDVWYLGTSIRSTQLPHLLAWAREVRSADRTLRRPLMADVITAEGVASRKIDFVGISQNSVGGLTSFGESRNRSFLRQNASAQLTLPWEWIQTEHPPGIVAWRRDTNSTAAVVEPEQILMQMVSCLSAGSRGIGFWKTRRLLPNLSADLETTKAIQLANLYLEILEPLLIKGHVDRHIPIPLATAEATAGRKTKSWTDDFLPSSPIKSVNYTEAPDGPDAAVINSPGTSLILAAFWNPNSQFVPQPMYASATSLVVNATETASAWRVTPTGVRGIRRQPTAGGLKVELDDFDQLALVLVTSDLSERQRLAARVQERAQTAATLFVELAKLKLARVSETCHRIDAVAGEDSAALRKLDFANSLLARAEQAFARSDYPGTESLAKAAMRETRSAQNRYWQRAVSTLPGPTASPHTISFSTLGDHWQMMADMRSRMPSQNMLPSGNFDSFRLLSDGNWKPVVTQEKQFYASAEIHTESGGRNQVMIMRAWPRSETASHSNQPALLVQCPELTVDKGDLLEITVKVRFGQGVQTLQPAPLLIFDSDLGPELAVNPTLEPSWQKVTIYREASESGLYKIWLGLKGPAEVYVDDFSVVRRPAAASPGALAPAVGLKADQSANPAVPVSESRSRVQGAGYANP
ncbi:hypothetical protein [Fuerstiella marisgermanici]|uniref:Uncharacterized protein n=1 Tax=Fuerstiella marisgermanici TaxID=1891926 RepID=A0A1P8WRW2_9PLAN|nr:hypothetical protein [Fuerstiella marisgermanici]APZ96791.1 hypothetical protein Fuma_06465 [Fuerstiella marisgermanici]